ncbi:MAG: hydantoinase B/oxoprolinase family protein, partial [Desulfobacterales bacterium]|nr:hydantoinase B/oxoprolinase family protein [Desulfobacterales bacterium]
YVLLRLTQRHRQLSSAPQLAVPRRHPPARHDRRHAGVRSRPARDVQFFTASRAHHADVGGITPGSMPPGSRDIAEEGALIDADAHRARTDASTRRLVRRLLLAGPWPARNVAQNLADLRAQLAANARGSRELERAAADARLASAAAPTWGTCRTTPRRACAARSRRLRDGSFRYEMDNGQAIVVRRARGPRRGHAPSSTSPARRRSRPTTSTRRAPSRWPRCCTCSARWSTSRSRSTPAACVRSRSSCRRARCSTRRRRRPWSPATSRRRSASSTRCTARSGVQAAAQGTMNNFTFGNERYQYYETIAGGAGAGPGYDGASGVQTHMTNSRLTDPEVLERRFPVLLREFALRAGSGGDGRVPRRRRAGARSGVPRGDDGGDPRQPPSRGAVRAGGRRRPGRVGVNRLVRARRPLRNAAGVRPKLAVDAGDRLRIETPGGGGCGRPGPSRRLSAAGAARCNGRTAPAPASAGAACPRDRRAGSGTALHGHARVRRQLAAARRPDAAARARVGHHERAPRPGAARNAATRAG